MSHQNDFKWFEGDWMCTKEADYIFDIFHVQHLILFRQVGIFGSSIGSALSPFSLLTLVFACCTTIWYQWNLIFWLIQLLVIFPTNIVSWRFYQEWQFFMNILLCLSKFNSRQSNTKWLKLPKLPRWATHTSKVLNEGTILKMRIPFLFYSC